MLLRIDTRILPARILPGVFNRTFKAADPISNWHVSTFFTHLNQIEDLLELFDRRTGDPCRMRWTQFINKYSRNFLNVLLEKLQRSNSKVLGAQKPQGSEKNPISSELARFILESHLSPALAEYLDSELTNTTILPKIADDCKLCLSQIIDELLERGLPILEKVLALLSQLRGPLTASPDSAAMLGFELKQIQALINITNAMHGACEKIINSLVEAKNNVHNLLVFFNSTVLKIHRQREEIDQLNRAQNSEEAPVTISNQQNLLAKFEPDLPSLTNMLDKGDEFLLLRHIAHFFDVVPLPREANLAAACELEEDLLSSMKRMVQPAVAAKQ